MAAEGVYLSPQPALKPSQRTEYFSDVTWFALLSVGG